ncbi:lysophospholipid acyltransferase family protein [Pelistega europaea]|uniref:Lysophospholipid acyltransferase family protein n=1 Tax=Pelistega europaea TaxID=106147 RepID=A0A7Y4P6Y3_9BURK|nr:lysophospholipid acyltransferase family protein [Pelistega europaea]NOL50384.1 lysophospholipid acyltransferase family protein [Pelistega europaea]
MQKSFTYRLIEFLFRKIAGMSHKNRLKLGAFLSWLFPKIAKRRAHIVRTNLRLCFPEASEAQIEDWVKQNIRLTTQSFIDRAVLWYAPLEKIHEISCLTGFENLQKLLDTGEPTIILAPHFIGLDTAATVLTSIVPEGCTMYKSQRNPDMDEIIRKGRARFNIVHLLSRKDGFRGLVRFLRKGIPLYYLPDMDFGRDESIFVPFFNIQSATLPSTAQIAKMFNAKVTPVVTRLDIETGIYHIEQLPALEDFPGEDSIEEATARINQLLEEWIRRDPAQYYWVHRRFKTRPEGEADFY